MEPTTVDGSHEGKAPAPDNKTGRKGGSTGRSKTERCQMTVDRKTIPHVTPISTLILKKRLYSAVNDLLSLSRLKKWISFGVNFRGPLCFGFVTCVPIDDDLCLRFQGCSESSLYRLYHKNSYAEKKRRCQRRIPHFFVPCQNPQSLL